MTLPNCIWEKLFEFQREGVLFALRHGGRALIADEMGLGKTVQAISAALCYLEEWPLLVLCPASLCSNWRIELIKWMELAGLHDPASCVHVVRSGKDKLMPEEGGINSSWQVSEQQQQHTLVTPTHPFHSLGVLHRTNSRQMSNARSSHTTSPPRSPKA